MFRAVSLELLSVELPFSSIVLYEMDGHGWMDKWIMVNGRNNGGESRDTARKSAPVP